VINSYPEMTELLKLSVQDRQLKAALANSAKLDTVACEIL
jgi:hypothetical protein